MQIIKYFPFLAFTFIPLFSIDPIKQAIVNYDPVALRTLLREQDLSKKEVKEYINLIYDIIADQAKRDTYRKYWPPMTTLESVLMGTSLVVGLSSAAAIFYYGLYKQDTPKACHATAVFGINLLITIIVAIVYDINNKNTILEMQEILNNI